MAPIIGVSQDPNVPRPMEGLYLRDALKRLAEIATTADGLRFDLEPLTPDQIEEGMEPLPLEDIGEALKKSPALLRYLRWKN